MNNHMLKWLQAYHDGELTSRQRAQVEAHLPTCAECQTELDALQALSEILQSSPTPQSRTRPDQFVAQVQLQLGSARPTDNWRGFRRAIWLQIPLGLMFALLVLKTMNLANNLYAGVERFALGGNALSNALAQGFANLGWTVSSPTATLDTSPLYQIATQFFGVGSVLGIPFGGVWLLPAVLGLLYLSWLAGWWVTEER